MDIDIFSLLKKEQSMKIKLFALALSFLMTTSAVSGLSRNDSLCHKRDIDAISRHDNAKKFSNKMSNRSNDDKSFNDYLEPVYRDYVISDVQTYSNDSTKDEYEDNNSFESATNITGKSSIEATLHRDPWYYLFWRNIDEDYYRIDILGDATLHIELTNIPYGCDYDLELYKHSNSKDSSFDDVTLVDNFSYSRKANNVNESITRNVTPNTYYVRVYPYGEKSYDAVNKYRLNFKIDYNIKNDTYSNLKYNLGAGGALWLSDFDPIGIKAFSSESAEYAGFFMASNGAIASAYANPIFDYLEKDRKIEHATLYLWDNNWKKALWKVVEQLRITTEKNVNANQKFKATLELIEDEIGTIGTIAGLALTFVNPTSGALIVAAKIGGVISTIGPAIYGPIVKSLFPDAWDTTKEKYLNYLEILSTALRTTDQTSDSEIIKISSYYKITSTSNALSGTTTYYCDFTPEYDPTGYKYNGTDFYAYHNGQIFNGKIFGIVNPEDLNNAINRNYISHDEINTGGNRVLSIGEGIIDELHVGQYHWFNFTAPTSGYYRFYTEGTTDTYLSIFNQIVPSRSLDGELKHDDDSGVGLNCSLTYKLRANQTLYLRVSGFNWSKTGLYHLKAEELENVYDVTDTIKLKDYGFKEKYEFDPITTQHKTEHGLEFSANRLRCGVIDKSYLSLSAKRKDAGLAYIEYEFSKIIYTVEFNLAIWSEEEYLNKESSISFDYKDMEGKWRRCMNFDIAKLSKSKDKLDNFYVEFPEDAYGFRFVVRTNDVNYEKNKGRVVIGDISVLYSNS